MHLTSLKLFTNTNDEVTWQTPKENEFEDRRWELFQMVATEQRSSYETNG